MNSSKMTIIVLVVVLVITVFTYENRQGVLESDIAALQDSTSHYKTKSGKEAAEIATLQGDLKKVSADLNEKVKELGIKNVQNVSTIKVSGGTRVVVKPGKSDTVVVKDTVFSTTIVRDSSGGITADFDIKLSLDVATGTKRKNIFSKTELVTVVKTNDERFKVDEIKSWNKAHEGPKLLMGPAVISGIGYDFIDKDFTAMVGVGIALQRWK